MARAAGLVVLFLLALGSSAMVAGREANPLPRAERGVLDLRSWAFAGEPIVTLDGEWEFYWGQLLTPDDFAHLSAPPPDYIPVPRRWNGYEVGGRSLPGEGYATYRLVVLLPDDVPAMAVKMYSAATAYRMWFNGQLVASNGRVATRREEAVAQATPRLAGFVPTGERTEIVVQVSNFHHWRGGLWRPILLGTATGLMQRAERDVALGAFFLGSILILSLYLFALWWGHRKYRTLLYFSLFSAGLVIRTTLLGEVLLSLIVPNFGYAFHLKMEYLPVMLGIPVIAAFAREMYPLEFPCRFLRWAVASGVASAALVLAVPTWTASRVVIAYEFLVLFPVLMYLLYGLALAVLRRRPMAGSWFVGAFAATVIGLNDVLHYQHVISTDDLGLIGLVLIVLVQSINVGRKFAQTLRQQELLTDQNRKLIHHLRQHIRALQITRHLAIEREEQLRREIAEGLHGPVQNRLLHAWYQLGKARESVGSDSAKTTEMIEQVRAEIDQVRENDIRTLSHLLHPAIIEVGLLPALHSLAARYRRHFEIEIESTPEVRALDRARVNGIPEPVRLSAYRIVEEALANVAQHAQATKVNVALDIISAEPSASMADEAVRGDLHADRHLWVSVYDNGKGLPPDRRAGTNTFNEAAGLSGSGLGLHLIDGRVSGLGGVWSLTPAAEGGTRLEVWLPLPAVSTDGSSSPPQSLPSIPPPGTES